MPYYPGPGPRTELPEGRSAGSPQARPRVSPVSPAYYLGIPAHVWVAAMSRKNGSKQRSCADA
jgi:hypothetical protein